MLEADAAALKLRQDECGLTTEKLAVEETDNAEFEAMNAILEMPATTMHGFIAAVVYVQE
jgi:hypothetical protein